MVYKVLADKAMDEFASEKWGDGNIDHHNFHKYNIDLCVGSCHAIFPICKPP